MKYSKSDTTDVEPLLKLANDTQLRKLVKRRQAFSATETILA